MPFLSEMATESRRHHALAYVGAGSLDHNRASGHIESSYARSLSLSAAPEGINPAKSSGCMISANKIRVR